MDIPYFIKRIFEEKKITDILSDRGIFPSKKHSDKWTYKCPIHEGDNDPSFIVYLDSEYENYYCYGCHSGGTCINLLSDLDDISVKQSIRQLVKGVKIDNDKELDSLINDLDKDKKLSVNTVEEISLELSNNFYDYLIEIKFDEEELKFVEDVLKKIDKLVQSKDLESLDRLASIIIEIGLPHRKEKYLKRKEKELVNNE